MNPKIKNFKVAFGALGLGAGLLLSGGASANAQRQYDPYYGQGTYHQHDNNQHRKNEKRAEKRHQKDEKEDLKAHQREERDQYGNDGDLSYHQRQEREELKRHEREEKNARKNHQRTEANGNGGYNRDDGYYRNDGYNRNDGYGSDVSQAAFDRGYQEGVRAGQDDRYNNRRYDVQNHSTYRDAMGGYNSRYGDRNSYRNSFREGYQRGYDEGYNTRNSGRSGSRGRDILGTIFGRP